MKAPQSKNTTVPPHHAPTPGDDANTNLTEWLEHPSLTLLLGRAASIKLDVLALHLSGNGTLAAIARRHGVSKAAITRHSNRVKELFGATRQINEKLTRPAA